MPRKAKPLKYDPTSVVVQKLSTGEIVRPKNFVDDFSDEVIPLPEYYGPFKPPEDERAKYLARRKRAHEAVIRLIPGHGYHLNKPQPPKLAFNQVLTESGLVLTPKVPRKPWRRL